MLCDCACRARHLSRCPPCLGDSELSFPAAPQVASGAVAEDTIFEDLYDIERRPGAGAALWTAAVERQFERVRDANYRHRLHHSLNDDERRDDPDAERQLHADVYFLALAIRRVLLFHDLLAKQVTDPRLTAAREAFNKNAPDATTLRNFYEHLDE